MGGAVERCRRERYRLYRRGCRSVGPQVGQSSTGPSGRAAIRNEVLGCHLSRYNPVMHPSGCWKCGDAAGFAVAGFRSTYAVADLITPLGDDMLMLPRSLPGDGRSVGDMIDRLVPDRLQAADRRRRSASPDGRSALRYALWLGTC